MEETLQVLIPAFILLILILVFVRNVCNSSCGNENENEKFNLTTNPVPLEEKLKHQQLNPLNKARILPKDNSNVAPDFKMNDSDVKDMKYNSIYRQKTGRQAFELENFVSIYDSNFGGLLGTSMGLTSNQLD